MAQVAPYGQQAELLQPVTGSGLGTAAEAAAAGVEAAGRLVGRTAASFTGALSSGLARVSRVGGGTEAPKRSGSEMLFVARCREAFHRIDKVHARVASQ